jgi:hypothetical protein
MTSTTTVTLLLPTTQILFTAFIIFKDTEQETKKWKISMRITFVV